MIIVMRVVGFADDSDCPIESQYLKSFDHEACNGQGWGEFTFKLDDAMRFYAMQDAVKFWQKIPACRPLRDDGKPNRPMTSTTMEFLRLDKLTSQETKMTDTDTSKEPSAFQKLDNHLDHNASNLFDDKAIDLQIESLHEMEAKGLASMIISCKDVLQKKLDKAVVTDLFQQGLKLVQLSNRQTALLILIRACEQLIDDPNKKQVLKGFATEKMVELLDIDTHLGKLMESVRHILKTEAEKPKAD